MTTPNPPTPIPALALVVIAHDEAASIGACLQSAAAVVETMIVLVGGLDHRLVHCC